MNATVFQTNHNKLNPEQLQAVENTEGALMVIAGPGSGKTQILSMRIANILLHNDVNANNILCLTFTNAAAKNMQDRLSKIIGPTAFDVNICTFHSFGSLIINQYQAKFFDEFGLDARQAEPIAQQQVFEEIMKSLAIGDPLASRSPDGAWLFLRDAKNCISDLRKGGLTPLDFEQVLAENKPILEQFQIILDKYQTELCGNLQQKENQKNYIIAVGDLLKLWGNYLEKVLKAKDDKNIFATKGNLPNIKATKPSSSHSPFGKDFLINLGLQYEHTLESEKPRISEIKNFLAKYLTKDKNNNLIFKDLQNFEKQVSLCNIYKLYREKMFKQRLYDFDDMILEVVQKIKTDQELKNNLLEKYQYILVDEFQDTSGVQLELITQLTDTIKAANVEPNIMVVGDDDQAIYKFQGASTSNLLKFTELYPNCQFITLQKNYRSSHKIVETCKGLASNITDRITNLIPQVNKNSLAHNIIEHSKIHHLRFDSTLEESLWIVEKCQELIKTGTQPNKIAVLSRSHKDLAKVIEISSKLGLATNYEKGNNILNEVKIQQLIKMMEYVDSLNNPNSKFERDDILCEILQYDFFGFTQLEIRSLAILAKQNRLSWLDTMLNISKTELNTTRNFLPNQYSIIEHLELEQSSTIDIISKTLDNLSTEFKNEIQQIAFFFTDLAKLSLNEPGELIIDRLIGVDTLQSSDDTRDEDDGFIVEFGQSIDNNTSSSQNQLLDQIQNNNTVQKHETKSTLTSSSSSYLSNYKYVYFDKLLQKVDSQKDLKLLSNLRYLINSIRGFSGKKILTLSEIVQTLRLYQDDPELSMIDNSTFMTTTNSVNLMTAHKSKGLEFDIVFVINCTQDNWCGKNISRKINLLSNLNLAGEADNNDDKMRLFYVALTRAQNHIYLSTAINSENGESKNELSFLQYIDPENIEQVTEQSSEHNYNQENKKGKSLEVDLQKKLNDVIIEKQEYKILEALLQDYKMPVTHLNNFLDMDTKAGSTKRGPAKFLEANLLKFPQTPSPTAGYGTAMHKALQDFYNQNTRNNAKPDLAFLLENFETSLDQQKMTRSDRKKLREFGTLNLTKWFSLKDKLENNYKVEHSFGSGVKLGEATITGNLDKIILDTTNRLITVVDYKTGKIFGDWDRYVQQPKNGIMQVGDIKTSKEQGYSNQLIFYKLLVESSPEFKNKYNVNVGQIEFLDCSAQATNYDYKRLPVLDLLTNHIESERLHKIIQSVWRRIMRLDFSTPKVYEDSIAGTKEWMDFLEGEANQ